MPVRKEIIDGGGKHQKSTGHEMDILHAHVSQISETDQGCQYETDENRKKVHQPKAVDLQDFIALIHIYASCVV